MTEENFVILFVSLNEAPRDVRSVTTCNSVLLPWGNILMVQTRHFAVFKTD